MDTIRSADDLRQFIVKETMEYIKSYVETHDKEVNETLLRDRYLLLDIESAYDNILIPGMLHGLSQENKRLVLSVIEEFRFSVNAKYDVIKSYIENHQEER